MNYTLGVYLSYGKIFLCVVNYDAHKIEELKCRTVSYKRIKNKYFLSRDLRKTKIKELLKIAFNIPEEDDIYEQMDSNEIYELRVKALNTKLSDIEFAKVLYYICFNRGQSNCKINDEFYKRYRTFGEYIFKTDKVNDIKNVSRNWIVSEIQVIFEKQRDFDKSRFCNDFEDDYLKIFSYDFNQVNTKKKKSAVKAGQTYNDKVVEETIKAFLEELDYLVLKYNSFDNINIYADCVENVNAVITDVEKKMYEEYYFSKYKKNISNDEMIILKLFQESQGISVYSGKRINLANIFDEGYCEVDHIIPKSRNGGNSYSNKVLVLWEENRDKDNMIPFEYIKIEEKDSFRKRVLSLKIDDEKKRRLLSKTDSFDLFFNRQQRGVIFNELNELLFNKCIGELLILKNFSYFETCCRVLGFAKEFYDKNDGYLFSLLLCGIYDETIKCFEKNKDIRILENIIKYSFWSKMENDYKDALENVIVVNSPEYFKKKLIDLTKEDLGKIDVSKLNKSLYDYIVLRMEQYNYDGMKAFSDDVFMPSKKGNGTVIKSILLKT